MEASSSMCRKVGIGSGPGAVGIGVGPLALWPGPVAFSRAQCVCRGAVCAQGCGCPACRGRGWARRRPPRPHRSSCWRHAPPSDAGNAPPPHPNPARMLALSRCVLHVAPGGSPLRGAPVLRGRSPRPPPPHHSPAHALPHAHAVLPRAAAFASPMHAYAQ